MVEKNKMFQLFANLFMCILCVLCILPFMLLFASSLTNERTLIQDGYRFFTTKIDFAAYKYIFVDTDSILRGYGVSVLVTVVGTVTNLVITTLFAYPLSMKELPGRRFLSFFLFFTMLFNGGLIPTYIMWTQFFKNQEYDLGALDSESFDGCILCNYVENVFYKQYSWRNH